MSVRAAQMRRKSPCRSALTGPTGGIRIGCPIRWTLAGSARHPHDCVPMNEHSTSKEARWFTE